MKNKKQPETEVLVLDGYSVTRNSLIEFVSQYSNIVVTRETLKDAKSALSTIRQKRFDVQNQRKANDKARIEWNTKYLESNKTKEAELIEIISPVEDPLAEKIKFIEDEIQREKDLIAQQKQQKIAARTQRIINTGAQPIDAGFQLDVTYISNDEISVLPDGAFDIIVEGFEKVAKHLALKAEAEAKEKADREKRIKTRTAKLFEIGMLRGADGFVCPFGIDITDDMISDEIDLTFDAAVNNISELFEKKKKEDDEKLIAQKEKEAADKAKEDQQAKEKELLEKQKNDLIRERIMSRESHLHTLGFAKTENGFTFKSIFISENLIAELDGAEWTKYSDELVLSIAEVKRKAQEEIDANKKTEEEKALIEKQRIEALQPDKEKLMKFIESIKSIGTPDVKSKEAIDIVFESQKQLDIVIQNIEYEISKLK